MKFADIPYHYDTKERLRAMVDDGKMPHALLLEGPGGSGKFALARALAQYIHCEHRTPDGDSCGVCPACQQHQSFNHIDTIFSFPVVKKGNVAISDDFIEPFRQFLGESQWMSFEDWCVKLDNINAQPKIYVEEANELIRRLNYTSHASRYKIVLMWLPERMNNECANKLLKLVEEPHSDTIFIMVTDDSRQILPTIYSRTQRVQVKRYTDAEVAQILASLYQVEAAEAAQIASIAAGNINEALSLSNVSAERKLFLDLFIDLMRKAYARQVADLKKWAEEVAALGREREMNFLDYCARMIRENFILNLKVSALNSLNKDEAAFSARFSPFINERNVLKLFNFLNEAKNDIAANANAKLVNFDLSLKVILLLKS